MAPNKREVRQGFEARVISFEGDILYSKGFHVQTTPTYEPPKNSDENPEGQTEHSGSRESLNEETSIVLILPYYANADRIEILNRNNDVVSEIDVSQYSERTDNDESGVEPDISYHRGDSESQKEKEESSSKETRFNFDEFFSSKSNRLVIGFIILLMLILFLDKFENRQRKRHKKQ